MRIKKVFYRHVRDFIAICECENCGDERVEHGYDQENFHENVIPKMICLHCNNRRHDDYVPSETKYEEFEVI